MKIAFYTLGCKVNQYETQILSQRFSAQGYDVVSHEEQADVYVVNSCTVTAEGDRKTRQMLRRFKKQNPASRVALTGCFPQAFPDAAELLAEADIISGTRSRETLLDLVAENLRTGHRIIQIVPHEKNEPFEGGKPTHNEERTRAFVKIQDGCQQYCAYCIIPTARGYLRSKPIEELTSELDSLAEEGFQEAVLTGINLSCYGKELGLRIADGVEAACASKMRRIRLGSLEPERLEPEDIARLFAQKKLCPQFHMSLQSGCDQTLRRMRRQYTTIEYEAITEELRRRFPNCAITTDIMTGFPGETDEEFAESLAFAKKMRFAKAHVFAYSRRPGTKADKMENQIPNSIKSRRAAILSEAMEESRQAFLASQIGKRLFVLFEGHGDPVWEGYGENYVSVRVESSRMLHGKVLPVIIQGIENGICVGNIDDKTEE